MSNHGSSWLVGEGGLRARLLAGSLGRFGRPGEFPFEAATEG